MIPRNSYRWLLGVTTLGLLVLSARAEDQKSEQAYRKMIDERAARALKDKDVPALVESAFALYPLETTARVKNPKCQKLLAKAADLVLEKKDAKGAGMFLETAAPLTASLKADQRHNLETLARGKSIDEIASQQAEVARGGTKAVGTALADPEAKPRGDDLRQAAEALGKAMVNAMRYADTPLLRTYSWDGRTLKATVEWAGVFTGWKYTSQIEIEFEQVGGKTKIRNLYYSDNTLSPPDDYHRRAFIQKYNSQ